MSADIFYDERRYGCRVYNHGTIKSNTNERITPLDILNADPSGGGIFECCIGNVTLRPIIYLLRINISAFGRNMISKSAI